MLIRFLTLTFVSLTFATGALAKDRPNVIFFAVDDRLRDVADRPVGKWGASGGSRLRCERDAQCRRNLAAVVSLLARDRSGPALRFQLLVYAAVDARQGGHYRSREQNAEGPFLPWSAVEYFTGHYLAGEDAAREDVRVSPLLAPSHRALPSALVVTAEFDPLRDEGEAYARALEGGNVPVRLHRYDGMPHVFFQLSPIVEDGGRLIEEASAALREALA